MDKKLVLPPAQSHSRQLSLRRVFREVVESGAISRAELSRRTGYSKQTMSDVVRDLLADGWLREVGRTHGAVGRSATNYELNSRRAYVWGGDLGGTKLAVAIADLSGEILAEHVEETEKAGGEAVIGQIRRAVVDLAGKIAVPMDLVLAGALGVPGAFDRKDERLRLVSNLPGLEDCPIERKLREALHMPVFVENDVTVAAKGELWRGRRREADSFAFLALGTGVGLGIVSEGRLVRGARGAAGEIAWLPVGGDVFDSRNFASGTLENAVSSHAILERYRARGGRNGDQVPDLFDRWIAGDAAAETTFDDVARILAAAISAIASVLDPELVVTGGSIGARAELVTRIRDHLRACMPHPVPVEISVLGGRAGQVGAVGMAVDHVRETLFGQPDMSAGAAR